MMKKALCIHLAVLLTAASLTACRGGQSNKDNTVGQSGEIPSHSDVVSDLSKQDPYTVKIMYWGDAKTEDVNEVAKEASKITKKLLGTDIQLTRVGFGSYDQQWNVGFGSYDQQLNLMLASNEKLDLFPTFGGSKFVTMANIGQILPLNDLLQQHGKEMFSLISNDDWKAVTVGGKIYGVPANKEKVESIGFFMVKKIADELNIDYKNIKTMEQLGKALEKVHQTYPDMYPVTTDKGTVQLPLPVDRLGDSLGVLENQFDSRTKVVNLYNSDSYKKFVNTMWNWAQKGLLMKDASSNTQSSVSLIGAGEAFGSFSVTKPGFEAQASIQTGKEMVYSELLLAASSTGSVQLPWSIAHNSGQPARAMQVLNLMYTNSELSNLLINGIEGKHYKIIDKAKGIIDFPDGVSFSNNGYSSLAWGWPNEQISFTWKGSPENLWKVTDEFSKSAAQSPAKGFVWDNSKVLNEITACSNVIAKYVPALNAGSIDPAIALPKLNSELEAAGINKIIAEKQAQLDQWLKVQK